MQITPATPADIHTIHAMVKALSDFHDDTATITVNQLHHAIFESGLSQAFVARAKGATVGYAGVNRTIMLHTGAPRFDIQHLYVAETHRSTGVGRTLIAAAVAMAKKAGARGVTIGTDPRNATAIAAYRGMGLEEITDAGPRFWIPASA